jgi:hypothetical protein
MYASVSWWLEIHRIPIPISWILLQTIISSVDGWEIHKNWCFFPVYTRGSEPAEGRASAQKALNPLVSEITPAALKIHPYPLFNFHLQSKYFTYQKLKISYFQSTPKNPTQLEIV